MTNPTAQSLEQHFDVAFTAPNGIKKLRELILTLAMQGKLVPQDANDTPASELLKDIASEKERLVSEGKIKKQKPLPAISDNEKPYNLPQGWEWVRLREISFDWGQKTPDQDFFYIDVGSVNNTKGALIDDLQIVKAVDAPSRARKLVSKGTVIYSTVRPYLLNIAVIEKDYDKELIASTAFAIIHTYSSVYNYFVYHYLKSPVFIQYVESTMKGVAYPAINDGDFFQGFIPLPPLAEQHRIVAKIDQLMARCDALEALQQAKEAQRLSVHQAAIRQLLDAEHTHTAWQFLQTHFAELYSVKANVSELRKAILQLAVMGKLVPQDPNDTPASELLKEIASEKARLVSEGKIKKQKPLPAISDDEKPYDLPQGWEWVRLNQVFSIITDGDHQAPPQTSLGIPFLVIGNLNRGHIKMDGCRFVPESYFENLDWSRKPVKDDILYTVTGSYGIPILVTENNPFCVQRHVAILKSISCNSVNYILFLLKTRYAFDYATSISTGIAQKTVPLTKLREMPIPLPPLAEQHRIVAKIDHLMSLCDNLEQQIDASQAKQSELLAAVMSGV